MGQHTITASALIPAPPDQVYAIIADYRDRHPRILPKPEFVNLLVEQGGVGSGTVIRFQMRLMGRIQTFRAAITEPEPGRLLVETDLQGSIVTSFMVEPCTDPNQTMVTISTARTVPAGLFGRMDAWLAQRMLHPIYVRELAQLATVAIQ